MEKRDTAKAVSKVIFHTMMCAVQITALPVLFILEVIVTPVLRSFVTDVERGSTEDSARKSAMKTVSRAEDSTILVPRASLDDTA